jgi:thiamine pyrophosphokinase
MSFALVVCNGEPPDPDHLVARARSASIVVAADGGLIPLLEAGVHPDVLIGDLDSSFAPYPEGVKVVLDADQETNDLEKALNYVHSSGFRNILVLGATGLRLDQTLKNLSVLMQFNGKFDRLHFEDHLCNIRVADQNTELSLQSGTAISLFPISGKVDHIVTQGLKYPLLNESLENGTRDGSSNVVVSSPVSIQYKSGSLLLIINHKSFPAEWP